MGEEATIAAPTEAASQRRRPLRESVLAGRFFTQQHAEAASELAAFLHGNQGLGGALETWFGEKLTDLLCDVFLIDEEDASNGLRRSDVDTWDSLGTVALAVGVEEVFGYHMTPEEANGLESVGELVTLLQSRGVEIT